MPWDQGPDSRRNPWVNRGTDAEDILRRMGEGLRGRGLGPIWIFVFLALLWLLTTCFFKVDVEEVGVIQRFGAYARTVDPGLHVKLPSGVEKVTKVPVRKVLTEEFGLRTLRPGIKTEYASGKEYERESLMLTGDLNVAIVPWIVQYRIQDPYKYLFRVRNVRDTLRDLSQAIVSQVVGDRNINEVLNRREAIASEAKVQLQKALDEADTGLRLVNLELKTTNVPEPVQPAFNDVNKATQDKEKMTQAAEEQYNREIPAAEGEVQKVVQEAMGYRIDRVNRAKGDAARFLSLWEEYKRAPEVTRRRLYLETMTEVLPRVGRKYVLDQDQRGILPLLELGGKGGAP
ncbi:MAG: FtsH protease activity modulator HflK [Thermodesulfobacteriota bacterium]